MVLAAKNTIPAVLEEPVDFLGVWFGVLWLVGALFTWRKKTWAAVLLAILAVYDFVFDLIPCIRTLSSDVRDMSAEFGLAESTVFAVGIVVYSLGTVLLLCVLYYGLCMVTTKKED